MRKILSIILGAGMFFGGAYLLYDLLFYANRIPLMIVSGGGLLVFVGGYVVFDVIKNWRNE
jgi:hypothetical protein